MKALPTESYSYMAVHTYIMHVLQHILRIFYLGQTYVAIDLT